MNALIAATCIAVLAAVGYFFYGEYAEAQRIAAHAEQQSVIRGCEQFALNMPYSETARRCREQGYIK